MDNDILLNISKNLPWLNWNKNAKKRKLTKTLELTYDLFIKGKSINEIIKLRNFKEDSIQRQIIDLITMGFINIDDIVDKKKKEKIISIITKNNILSLKLIKESLPNNISYFEIKSVLAYINLEPERRINSNKN